jgi:hypothetical protein
MQSYIVHLSPKENKMSLMKMTVLQLAVMAGALSFQQSSAKADTDCNAYANEAYRVYQEAKLYCPASELSGPRWVATRAEHRGWCQENASSGAPESEENARAETLQACKTNTNQTQNDKPAEGAGTDSAQLFEDYEGVSVCVDDDFTDCRWSSFGKSAKYVGNGMNDDVQSITVGYGMEVTLYEHRDYQGRSITLSCGAYILSDELTGVSSIKVRKVNETSPYGCSLATYDEESKIDKAERLAQWN